MNIISLNFLEKNYQVHIFIFLRTLHLKTFQKTKIISPLFSLFFFSPSSNTKSAILISNPRLHFCPQFLLSHFRSSAKRQKGYKEVMLTLPPVYKSKQQEKIQHKNRKEKKKTPRMPRNQNRTINNRQPVRPKKFRNHISFSATKSTSLKPKASNT